MILLLILSAAAVFGQKAPTSFLEKRVTFTIPDQWQIQKLENGDTKWIEKAVADFNTTCETLKIDGTNSTKAKVVIETLRTKN